MATGAARGNRGARQGSWNVMSEGEDIPAQAPLTEGDRRLLAAFADGSLGGVRAARMQQRIEGSPQLAAELAAQRRAVGAARALDDEPPQRLRSLVEREHAGRRRTRRTRPLRLGVAAAAVAALTAVALVVLPSGVGDPTVLQAAVLAERPARAAAPAPVPGRPLLDRRAEGLAFPDWKAKFRWRATGARVDNVENRRATTVFYENPRGARIGYTIVSGAPLALPAGARGAVREGVRLRSVERDGRIVVTWLRGGHTCVLSGEGVARDVLLELAGWRAKGAIRV